MNQYFNWGKFHLFDIYNPGRAQPTESKGGVQPANTQALDVTNGMWRNVVFAPPPLLFNIFLSVLNEKRARKSQRISIT